MGNDGNIQQEEKINSDEIIENDCYEEIDLNKINKILKEEKQWNHNSIIYSVNDLKDELNQINKDNPNENKTEEQQKNEEIEKKVNEEKENEENNENNENKENKEIKENEENNVLEQNNNINENKNEINQYGKEEKKENNVVNNNEEKINPPNNEEKDNNNITQEENKEKNNKIDNSENNKNKTKNPPKNGHRLSIKIRNLKPKIRPKNTRDEALRAPNSPKLSRKSRGNRKKKEDTENKKVEETSNNKKYDNKNNEDKKTEEKATNPIFEKKDSAEEYEITNIISEYRLNHLKDDEIIYSGTLEKILKFPDKNSIIYSERFCIFTKKYFAYYKSKENFITLNKPMFKINNNFIIRIENTTLDGGSYYFGIICEVNDETRGLINKVNSFVTQEANVCELLLGFRAKEYSTMMKWVVVLKYFITNQNEEF